MDFLYNTHIPKTKLTPGIKPAIEYIKYKSSNWVSIDEYRDSLKVNSSKINLSRVMECQIDTHDLIQKGYLYSWYTFNTKYNRFFLSYNTDVMNKIKIDLSESIIIGIVGEFCQCKIDQHQRNMKLSELLVLHIDN